MGLSQATNFHNQDVDYLNNKIPNRFDKWFVMKNILDVGRGLIYKPGKNLPCG